MKTGLVPIVVLALVAGLAPIQAAEITDVIDAADGDDPFDINIDIGFHSTLNRSKITHEWMYLWTDPQWASRPDFNELRYQQQIYAMDYMVEIGLFHDLELYVNLPWIISDKKEISFVNGVSGASSTLYRDNPAADPVYRGNALAVNPATNPSSKRDGIGDMQVGIKWAPFNDERDDTKSVWIIGLDFTIPSGKLASPDNVANGESGNVGMGHFVLTPSMLFSHRFKLLDPYVGLMGSIPIQGREAKNAGFRMPYHGGFLAGMEIVPWENKKKNQKFAIDVRLTTEYFSEVESKGYSGEQGTVTELSDFLVSPATTNGARQLQAVGNYTQFKLDLAFAIRAAEFVRLRFGVTLGHNSEHFITGADFCDDKTGEGDCTQPQDVTNPYRSDLYDDPGRRIRVEETTLFTYWLTGMFTF